MIIKDLDLVPDSVKFFSNGASSQLEFIWQSTDDHLTSIKQRIEVFQKVKVIINKNVKKPLDYKVRN